MSKRIVCVVLSIVCAGAAHAEPETLTLLNGDKLTGEVVQWDVDSVVIDHPQLGRVRLSLDQLDIDTGERPNRGLFGTRFLRGWKRTIDFGLSGKEGNSINTNITSGLSFSYDDEFKRWLFNARYFLNRDEDGVTDNFAIVNLRRDWLFPGSRWFARTAFRYQYDQFESWEHRTVLTVGPGYNILKREAHALDAVVAPTFTREWGDNPNNKGEILVGFDYRWTPAKRYTLSLSNGTYFEIVPDSGNYRNLTTLDLTIALLEEPALSFRAGIQNEYESDAAPGDEKNDLKYYTSLGIDF